MSFTVTVIFKGSHKLGDIGLLRRMECLEGKRDQRVVWLGLDINDKNGT